MGFASSAPCLAAAVTASAGSQQTNAVVDMETAEKEKDAAVAGAVTLDDDGQLQMAKPAAAAAADVTTIHVIEASDYCTCKPADTGINQVWRCCVLSYARSLYCVFGNFMLSWVADTTS